MHARRPTPATQSLNENFFVSGAPFQICTKGVPYLPYLIRHATVDETRIHKMAGMAWNHIKRQLSARWIFHV